MPRFLLLSAASVGLLLAPSLRGLVVEVTGARLTSTGALELTNPVAGLVH